MPRQHASFGRLLARTALPAAVLASAATGASPEGAQPTYGVYGTPGLIDMPTAQTDADATLATTVSRVGDTTRSTLTFQITPRLSGSFRYTALSNFIHPHSVDDTYYDRSFDLRYQLLTEGKIRPAVAIGLQDFIGTGLYGGEYVVASKTLAPGLVVTGGIGWGRFGSSNAFASSGSRPATILGRGGIPSYDQWFRGDMAAFGGLSYSPNDRLTVKLEYSSDGYLEETTNGGFNRKNSINYGIDYRIGRNAHLALYHGYGDVFGAQVTFLTNPRQSLAPGGLEGAPLPVTARPAGARADLGWQTEPGAADTARNRLRAAMQLDDLTLTGLDLTGTSATVRLRNARYGNPAQAIGRTARAMSRVLPASVESFTIVPEVQGVPMSAVHIARSDVEALENRDSAEMLARTRIVDAYGLASARDEAPSRFEWSLSPNLLFSMFDPSAPVRADLRARLAAEYRLLPNLVLSGSVSKTLVGNISNSGQSNTASTLPPVRTGAPRYAHDGDPSIDHLTLAHYAHPATNFYSRVTVGYLESMYAGVSGELLWKPVGSRLALGAELNYVRQRDFDQRFGLQDYDILMGRASAYYDFGNGYHGQLDLGRYLAGDYGATVSLDREFANGWRVGAYATLTDASAEDFGEGSFDKGLRITVPLAWASGKPSRAKATVDLKSLTRDGGAHLNVDGRLYEQVRDYHQPQLANSWGKFWR